MGQIRMALRALVPFPHLAPSSMAMALTRSRVPADPEAVAQIPRKDFLEISRLSAWQRTAPLRIALH
jgi:hypothetical protein